MGRTSRLLKLSNATMVALLLLGSSARAQSNVWVTETPLPTARSGMAVAAVGGKLYFAGGFDFEEGVLAQTLAYDPGSHTWQSLTPMPTPRDAAAAAVADGVMYVIGGFGDSDRLATLEAYNPSTNTWTTKASMPTPRYGAVAGVVGGIIYVAGGISSQGTVAVVEAYDPKTDTWTTKSPMPTARYGASAGVIGGTLYVAGGHRTAPGVTTYNVLEAYDPNADSWSTKPGMPYSRYWTASGVLDGMLYLAGGFASPGGDAMVAYDPNSESWQIEPSMLTARYLAGAGVLGDVFYVAGGLKRGEDNSITPVAVNEAFTPFERVSIDIKPGDRTNTINLKSNGVVPVAILGSATFDPMTVDPTTVTFAGAHVSTRGRGAPMTGVADVSHDGYPDLVLYFRTQDLTALRQAGGGTPPLQVEAVLYGTTYSGQRIRGSGIVRIVPAVQTSAPTFPRGRGTPTNNPASTGVPRGQGRAAPGH